VPKSECCPAPPDDSIFGGYIHLSWHVQTGGSSLVLTNDHTFTGAYGIIGEHSDCTLVIADAKVLTSELAGDSGGISGSLTIESDGGSAVLVNEGRVIAHEPTVSADGILVIDESVQFDDGVGATWEIGGVDVQLVFNAEATDLEGDFIHTVLVGAGTFVINEDIRTCGSYIRNCCDGKFDLASGKTFEFVTYDDGPNDCEPKHTESGTLQCGSNYALINADVGSANNDCQDD
jgi:hypothetical protein